MQILRWECPTVISNNTLCSRSPGPRPPAGNLRVRNVTHSTMWLYWDAAPGPVNKYLLTYQPMDGDVKEVSFWFPRPEKPSYPVSLACLLQSIKLIKDLKRISNCPKKRK